MKQITLLAALVLCTSTSFAGPPQEDSLKKLATDLTKLQASIENAYQQDRSKNVPSWAWGSNQMLGVKISASKGGVYSGASTNTPVITQVHQGASFSVVDKVEDWYAIQLAEPVMDLKVGWVKASDVTPSMNFVSFSPREAVSTVYDVILDEVSQLKEKYSADPYVGVKGFSIEIGAPPSVSIDFEFNE